jgi:hypothetical protein
MTKDKVSCISHNIFFAAFVNFPESSLAKYYEVFFFRSFIPFVLIFQFYCVLLFPTSILSFISSPYYPFRLSFLPFSFYISFILRNGLLHSCVMSIPPFQGTPLSVKSGPQFCLFFISKRLARNRAVSAPVCGMIIHGSRQDLFQRGRKFD